MWVVTLYIKILTHTHTHTPVGLYLGSAVLWQQEVPVRRVHQPQRSEHLHLDMVGEGDSLLTAHTRQAFGCDLDFPHPQVASVNASGEVPILFK